MKTQNLIKTVFVVIVLAVIIGSCKKDEGFTQVTAFEKSIHDAINKHRVNEGKTKMVLQYLMMDDAKNYSTKMANGTITPGTAEIMTDLQLLQTNLKGDASAVWITTCQYENADSVMNIILDDAEIKTTIEGNYNQSAVGAVKNAEGTYYITHLLMHIP